MANSSKAKLTPNQRAYAHQIKLLQKRIATAEKSGFRFFENVVPQTPDRIYKRDIERVKEIRGNRLYASATALNEETGEIVSGIEGAKLKRKESAKKGQQTRKQKHQENQPYYPQGGNIIAGNIVDSFIVKMHEPEPPMFPFARKMSREIENVLREMRNAKTTILSLTYQVIEEIGKNELGWRMQERADDVENCVNTIVYIGSSAEAVASACRELAEIIKGSKLTFSELQDLGEQEEYNESFELPQ